MKKTLLLALVCGSTIASAQLNVGLRAHWIFSGGSTDVSGNAHDGTIVGTVVPGIDRAGNPGCAFSFPGDSSRVDVPFHADFDIAPTAAFTLSLWYQGGSPDAGDLEWIFRKRNFPGFYHSWNYGVALYDINRGLYFGGDDGQLWSNVIPNIPDPQWHNLVGIYSNGTHQLWLDDVLVASDLSQTIFLTQSNQGISIGETFTGLVDDIRFYDRALSVPEVGLLFTEPAACSLTGIQDIAENRIALSPVPATNEVVVDLNGEDNLRGATVWITDATGRIIIRDQLRSQRTSVDVSMLANGAYMVHLGTGAKTLVRQFIKD